MNVEAPSFASNEQQEAPSSALDSTISARPEYNPVVRNIGNSKSLRGALDAMCAHCMGCTADHIEPGFRESIRDCSAPACPLWQFRPYQRSA